MRNACGRSVRDAAQRLGEEVKNTSVLAIIQARMNSSRLPGKVLQCLAGASLLERLIERIKRSHVIGTLAVTTTSMSVDDQIAELCNKLGVECFRGEEDDVLGRFMMVLDHCKGDLIVRLTADNPFVDGLLVDDLVERFQLLVPPVEYANNIDNSQYPYGLSLEIVKRATLVAANITTDPLDREHVTRYIRSRPEMFDCTVLRAPSAFRYERLTIDTPEDYRFAKQLFEAYYAKDPEFSYQALTCDNV